MIASLLLAVQRCDTWPCCDRKSRAACAQSFAPWQQATIEITQRDHSIIACSRHIHIFLFFAHIPFVVIHTINATPPGRLQQPKFSQHDLTASTRFKQRSAAYTWISTHSEYLVWSCAGEKAMKTLYQQEVPAAPDFWVGPVFSSRVCDFGLEQLRASKWGPFTTLGCSSLRWISL